MIGFWVALAGICLVALAWCLVINTSIGGTRSDVDDGSDTLFEVGMVLLLIGVSIYVVGQFQ